jgi:tetratricopeptide (TPR) repeat protein
MYHSSLFLAAVLVGTNMALVQQMAIALSAVEVGRIAKAIAVEIKEVGTDRSGSGILLQRQDDIYTVLTTRHVLESRNTFTLKTFDGQVHQAISDSVRFSGNNVDLAVVKLRSTNSYTLTKIGASNSLESGSPLYVAGFPGKTYTIDAGILNFTEGKMIGNATKGNSEGYSLFYSNTTLRGMSGGPVLNEAGELVAIHGQGDRDGEEGKGEKTGRNLGIVVERFGAVALAMGVQLDQRFTAIPQGQVLNASDYFLGAIGKDERGDHNGAIADYNQAIVINPKYFQAYVNRALLKAAKLNDVQGALTDYNQAILVNPKDSLAYYNRALLKTDKLNDVQGGLSDYNQAIAINPKYFQAYVNRALLKSAKLNDVQGALTDYNQAIFVNPQDSLAYYNRAFLKTDKLNDFQGALFDYNQAIAINPRYFQAYANRALLKTDKLNDVQGALTDYDQAIFINPKDSFNYYNRALLKTDKLNDVQGGLADYNQAIFINPKYFQAYVNRALLKVAKLNDVQGALTDYNQAIFVNPQDSLAYYGRAFMKVTKLNDVQGGLADYNQAIFVNPKDSFAYYNRALLKTDKLNDRTGAIQDLRQAARIYRELEQTQYLQDTIDQLQRLGTTE